MSTYLVALIAGPVRACGATSTPTSTATIPLGIFCRASLAEYMDAERLFTETKQGFDFYHQQLRRAVPVRQVRPAVRAGVQRRRDGERRRGDVPGGLRLPRPRSPGTRYERRAETVLHEMAHMWFGDLVTMRVVGRPVAQRVVRDVRLGAVPGRGHRVHAGLDDVRQRGEVLGLPAGPAAVDPPGRRRHPRPARRRGELRRHHLRQGRQRAQAAGRLRRARGVPGRAARLLPRPRVRQRHLRRSARRAGEVLGPRPVATGVGSGSRPPA